MTPHSKLREGDTVLVTNKTGNQFTGNYCWYDSAADALFLENVRALGGGRKIHQMVKFPVAGIATLRQMERSDPAIITASEAFSMSSRFQGGQNRWSNSQHFVPQNRGRFSGPRDNRGGQYQQTGYRSFQRESSSWNNRNGNRNQHTHQQQQRRSFHPEQQTRSHWQGRLLREGSFPIQFPIQDKSIGEYDIDKGLEEFSRMKLSNDDEEEKAEIKTYNKADSFFDSLKVDSPSEKVMVKKQSPRVKKISQNIETFGEETVRSLNFIGKPNHRNSRQHNQRSIMGNRGMNQRSISRHFL